MAINFNKLTLKSQESLQRAQEIAADNSNQQIEPAHLLQALIEDPSGLVSSIIMKLGASKDLIKVRLEEIINSYPKISGAST